MDNTKDTEMISDGIRMAIDHEESARVTWESAREATMYRIARAAVDKKEDKTFS